MSYQLITEVNRTQTSDTDWWFLYNDETKDVLIEPNQRRSYVSSPHIMVIGDTEEELLTYIEDNDLIVSDFDEDEL